MPPAQASAIPSDPGLAQALAAGPPLKYFRCPKGHEQQDTEEFSLRLGNRFTGQLMHDSGPLCCRCVFDFVNAANPTQREYDEGADNWYGAVFEFLTRTFETRRIAPPEPQEITPAELAAAVKAADQAEGNVRAPDHVDPDGVEHYRCLGEGCFVFISSDGPERPAFCPSCQAELDKAGAIPGTPPDVVNRFYLGETICGITMEPAANCAHCAEVARLPRGSAVKVTDVDQDTGVVTLEADADRPPGS